MNVDSGYASSNFGRQALQGPAIDALESAIDTNNGPAVDNDKWFAVLVKHRSRMDRLHRRIFKS
jgi:hypothetical protein